MLFCFGARDVYFCGRMEKIVSSVFYANFQGAVGRTEAGGLDEPIYYKPLCGKAAFLFL